MNQHLAKILNDEEAIKTLQEGLPFAFELAEAEASRVQLNKKTGVARATTGQEVGIHREHVLEGFLIRQLGAANVRIPMPGTPGIDTLIHNIPLEIKTATKRGLVTAKWTADTQSADQVLKDFTFDSDMLLVRIWWGKTKESLFYMPTKVLQEATTKIPKFLKSSTGTNNRGVKISQDFMKAVESHKETIRISINWKRSKQKIESPTDRYTKYWIDGKFPN